MDDQSTPTIAYVLMKAGELAAALHASGFTFPADDLLDPSNILIADDGRTLLAPLAPIEKLKPIRNPPSPLSGEEVIAALVPFATAIARENWTFFAAGYFKESELRHRGELARAAILKASPSNPRRLGPR